jgi:hypothetical protein
VAIATVAFGMSGRRTAWAASALLRLGKARKMS